VSGDSTKDSLFACRLSWSMPPVFREEKDAREYVEMKLVEADSEDAAIAHVRSRCSVLALEYGVTIEVVPVSMLDATRVLAKYDGDAMYENHLPTKAKLVTTRLGE
jgi:hypothetical protein